MDSHHLQPGTKRKEVIEAWAKSVNLDKVGGFDSKKGGQKTQNGHSDF